MAVVEVENVTRTYEEKGMPPARALRGVSLAIEKGEFMALAGPSGSGKTTLLNIIGGIDAASSGEVRVDGRPLSGLSRNQLADLRRDRIGFVFQAYNLVPTLTAIENITLPLDIAGRRPNPEWLRSIVHTLGLADRLSHRPSELSGGQQQRVACARALVSQPEIIFGDEPTGNLDSRSSGEVLGILRESVNRLGQTVVIVTHDPRAASYADRVVFLADGRIVDEMRQPTAELVLDRMKNIDGSVG